MTYRPISRRIFWGVVIFLLVAALIPAEKAPAQSTSCIAVDQNDQPRECTFLEEHGQCLWNALDSYDMCREDSESLFGRLTCELAVQVDLFACNMSLPWRLIESILH
jgi:hypothetical protein